MLAYVFWHQRASPAAREEYQARLAAFHRILQSQPPRGFHLSLALETSSLPWMREGLEVYEDWYLVENSAALDPLDDAAVSGPRLEPHNEIARVAAHGTGGLYRLKGSPVTSSVELAATRFATWFDKPVSMSYAQLYELLNQREIAGQGLLWQRKMTMGPAREFCLHSAQSIALPQHIPCLQIETRPISGSAAG